MNAAPFAPSIFLEDIRAAERESPTTGTKRERICPATLFRSWPASTAESQARVFLQSAPISFQLASYSHGFSTRVESYFILTHPPRPPPGPSNSFQRESARLIFPENSSDSAASSSRVYICFPNKTRALFRSASELALHPPLIHRNCRAKFHSTFETPSNLRSQFRQVSRRLRNHRFHVSNTLLSEVSLVERVLP